MAFKSRYVLLALGAVVLSVPLRAALQRVPSLSSEHSRWLNEEVVYIISDEERKEFLRLRTDAERSRFVQEFWEVRNPLRGAAANPFKEEHYRRFEYANQNFGQATGTPGWRTDMGRAYIVLGKPQSRASFKGYGQLYPIELWFYSNNTATPAFPPFFYVMFFIPEDIGEYRFYRPIMDGPMKLVRGSQFNGNRDVYNFLKPLGGDLARAAFTLVPSEPLDTQEFTVSMSGEMVVNRIQNLANDPFQVQRIRELRYLRERVKSWFMAVQDKPLDLSHIVLVDPAGQYWLDYAVLVEDEKLGRPDPSGKNLIVNAGFRLYSETGELIVEDAEERAYPAFEDAGAGRKFKPFLLANRVPMLPGKYKLEVHLDSREAGRTYRGERIIEIPQGASLLLHGPLLTNQVAQVAAPDPVTPFQYFGAQFVPSVDRRFGRERPLRVLFQLLVPQGEPRTLQVEYLLGNLQDRSQRQTLADTIRPGEFRNGTLLKARTIPLKEVAPGPYRLVLTVRPEGSQEVLASANAAFTIDDSAGSPDFFLLTNFRSVARSGLASYVRALQALSNKQPEQALLHLRQAVDQNPNNPTLLRALTQLYFNARKYANITELYNRLGPAAFSGAPEMLAQAALSFWHGGDRERAGRVLEAAETYFPKDTLLVAARKTIEQAKP